MEKTTQERANEIANDFVEHHDRPAGAGIVGTDAYRSEAHRLLDILLSATEHEEMMETRLGPIEYEYKDAVVGRDGARDRKEHARKMLDMHVRSRLVSQKEEE